MTEPVTSSPYRTFFTLRWVPVIVGVIMSGLWIGGQLVFQRVNDERHPRGFTVSQVAAIFENPNQFDPTIVPERVYGKWPAKEGELDRWEWGLNSSELEKPKTYLSVSPTDPSIWSFVASRYTWSRVRPLIEDRRLLATFFPRNGSNTKHELYKIDGGPFAGGYLNSLSGEWPDYEDTMFSIYSLNYDRIRASSQLKSRWARPFAEEVLHYPAFGFADHHDLFCQLEGVECF